MNQFATDFPKFPLCGRCHQEVLAHPMHYDGQSWYHLACWEEGLRAMHAAQARAKEYARRFGFATLSPPEDACP
mgnify:FL=1